MPKNKKQNLKTFYIADYLMSETDGELDEKGRPLHGVYVKDIQEYLLEKGIESSSLFSIGNSNPNIPSFT